MSPPQYEAGIVLWDRSGKRYTESLKIVDPLMLPPTMTLIATNLTKRLPGLDIVAYLPYCRHSADEAFNPTRQQALPWQGVAELKADAVVGSSSL
jgi:hypothetical protein